MHKTIEFQREELFAKVWAVPLLKLAQTIGVSDVALAKACRRAEIPLPGRGHWAKAEGDRRKQPSLPVLKNSYYQVVRFMVIDAAQTSIPAQPKPEKGARIVVLAHLDAPHPLVARTRKEAAKAKVEQGLIRLNRQRALDIRVSPVTLDRTLRLIDALIKASETQGHIWKTTKNAQTTVTINDQTFHLCVREKLDRHELPLPPPPPRPPPPPGRHRWEPNLDSLLRPRHLYEWTSTGKLSISIDGQWFDRAVQKNWNDTDRTPLEAKLHEVLAGFGAAAVAIQTHRDELERRRKVEAECAAQQQEEARHRAHQQQLRIRLVHSIERWEQAQRLRDFCSAVEARLNTLPPEAQVSGRAWLQWAAAQIDRLDPLHGNLESLFNLRPPKDTWLLSGAQAASEDDWWTIKSR